MPKKVLKITFFITAIMLVSSLAMGGYEAQKGDKARSKESLYDDVELFADGISAIRNDYVEEAESKKIIYGALRGMLSALDDFSSFMDPDEYQEISSEAKGEFGGIGIEIMLKDDIITVITPIPGTPADTAGVRPGDRIVRINGKSTKDMSLSDASKMLRGDAGTLLTMTVWREKDKKVLDLSMKRAIIKINSVKDSCLIEDKIGYVKLIEFQEKAGAELEQALKKLEGQGMDALILDLRNNPGGLLDSAIDVCEKFLPKDQVIVSTKSRIPAQNMLYKSRGTFQHPDYPIAVLVNEGSASASEIVAGALKDNKRGIIVGTKTFGKGSVQTVIPLKDGSALRLTTASYFTPNGKSIMHEGVMPDIVVAEREEIVENKELPEDIFEKIEQEGAIKPFDKIPGFNPQTAKTSKKEERPAGIKELAANDSQLQRAIDIVKALKLYKK